jgi:Phage integrase family
MASSDMVTNASPCTLVGPRGEGRTTPLNSRLFSALAGHSRWYTKRFGSLMPAWYVFPGRVGRPKSGETRPLDPTRAVTNLKTAWRNVKERSGVTGLIHDTRHTLITELAGSGAGDQTIMEIAGHVSRQMLARYSYIRMEAKRRALEAVETGEISVDQWPGGIARQRRSCNRYRFWKLKAQNRAQSPNIPEDSISMMLI